jgi:hypothetical protein
MVGDLVDQKILDTEYRIQNTEHGARKRRMKMKSYLGKSQFGEFLRNRKNALAMTAEKENLNDAPLPKKKI